MVETREREREETTLEKEGETETETQTLRERGKLQKLVIQRQKSPKVLSVYIHAERSMYVKVNEWYTQPCMQ